MIKSYTKQNLHENNFNCDDWGYFVDIEKYNNENQNNYNSLLEPTFIKKSINDGDNENKNCSIQLFKQILNKPVCLRPFLKKVIRATSLTAFIIVMSSVIICTM